MAGDRERRERWLKDPQDALDRYAPDWKVHALTGRPIRYYLYVWRGARHTRVIISRDQRQWRVDKRAHYPSLEGAVIGLMLEGALPSSASKLVDALATAKPTED